MKLIVKLIVETETFFQLTRNYCVLVHGHLLGAYSAAADANIVLKRTPNSIVESCQLNSEVEACIGAAVPHNDTMQLDTKSQEGGQKLSTLTRGLALDATSTL
eukprot:COSAG01_NODE_7398_length_3222_cov_6.196286_2_plen_103_part_00